MTTVINSGNVASGSVPTSETIIASLPVGSMPTRIRVRGHLLMTGNAVASTITIRVRESTVTGALLYTSGGLTVAASAVVDFPFEVEDTNNFAPVIGPQNSVWVVTVQASGAGTLNGGYVSLESVP